MISKCAAIAVLAAIAASGQALANVTVSTAATLDMNCSDGTCVPTATKAVLNASDLESYLSQFGNVRVMTTGSGVEAKNIVVDAAFSSPNSTSLTLDAHRAITINAAVSIGSGTSELELQSDTGGELGTLSFGRKGQITFGNLSDIFGINGGIFTLVGSVQGLASAVAANHSGAYALANSYNASQDGTYSSSPVATTFMGTLEGLGNTISHLAIDDRSYNNLVALFNQIGANGQKVGTVSNLRLSQSRVSAGRSSVAGILAGENFGLLFEDRVGGKVHGRDFVGGIAGSNDGTIAASVSSTIVTMRASRRYGGFAGGIAGNNEGTISNSYASGVISGTYSGGASDLFVGGLAGWNSGTINSSFATGAVNGGSNSNNGGLVGVQGGTIANCYSTGSVTGGTDSSVGGLIGSYAYGGVGPTSWSYSTGLVTGGTGRSYVGGFIGVDSRSGTISDAYWDTTTSGITDLSQGAGNVSNDPGITGLTTEQLQSGLPDGFDPKIWAEDSSINGGLPYLIADPPK